MANEIQVIQKELTCPAYIGEIADALKKDEAAARFYVQMAMYEIAAQNDGARAVRLCKPDSIYKCLVQSISVGLPIDNRHLAYLVAYGGIATLMPGYQGYAYKIKEADPTAEITIELVYKGDTFTCGGEAGTAWYKHIVANPWNDKAGDLVGGFCFVKTATGAFIERMSIAELIKIKKTSKMSNGPWAWWENEMYKKSLVRRMGKRHFASACAKLDALDSQHFDVSRKPVTATIAASAPMPDMQQQAIETSAVEAEQEPSNPLLEAYGDADGTP